MTSSRAPRIVWVRGHTAHLAAAPAGTPAGTGSTPPAPREGCLRGGCSRVLGKHGRTDDHVSAEAPSCSREYSRLLQVLTPKSRSWRKEVELRKEKRRKGSQAMRSEGPPRARVGCWQSPGSKIVPLASLSPRGLEEAVQPSMQGAANAGPPVSRLREPYTRPWI